MNNNIIKNTINSNDTVDFNEFTFDELAIWLTQEGFVLPRDITYEELIIFANEYFYDTKKRISSIAPNTVNDDGSTSVHSYTNSVRVQFVPSNKVNDVASLTGSNISGGGGGGNNNDRRRSSNKRKSKTNNRNSSLSNNNRNSLIKQVNTNIPSSSSQHSGSIINIEDSVSRHRSESSQSSTSNFSYDNDENDALLPPDKHRAEIFLSKVHPRNPKTNKPYKYCATQTGRHCWNTGCLSEGSDFFFEGAASELSRFGPGVSLYFKNLKLLTWIYFLLTIITLPQLILNSSIENNAGIFSFYSSTLGNLANDNIFIQVSNETLNYNNLTEFNILVNETNEDANLFIELPSFICIAEETCSIDRGTLGYFYCWNDLVAISVFTLSIIWMRYFVEREPRKISETFLTINQYTVFVPYVPPKINEEKLQKFFEDVLHEKVHDVSIAEDNGKLIQLYIDRGNVLNALYRAA